MQIIQDQTFDQERALYGSRELAVHSCRFDGPADGESAFKECRDIRVADSYFNLRYPFWHVDGLVLERSRLTPLCRAALWYTQNATVTGCDLHGIKALRECSHITLRKCDIDSAEFGWSVHDIEMEDSAVKGEYFMMRSTGLRFRNVDLKGKYSFQYIEDAVFENCNLDTKDAFWHARNVVVRNCTVKGEYLAWYCENVTFENCTIIGTQPLCYCKGLKLINCRMEQTDLSFERSEVDATIVSPVVSIKNPLSGCIYVPAVGEVIRDESTCVGRILVNGHEI